MGKVRYVVHRDLRDNIQQMTKVGGQMKKAASTLRELLYKIGDNDPKPFSDLKTTNHGETRLSKCVKYDLAGRARLITVQDEDIVFLLFAGDHEDSDKWLDRHKDMKFVVDNNQTVSLIPKSADLENRISFSDSACFHEGPLYRQITPAELFDRLTNNIPRSICRAIEEITGAHNEAEIAGILQNIENKELSSCVYDALILIKSDNIKEAHNRIKYFLGDLRELSQLASEEIESVKFGDTLIEFRPDDQEFLSRADKIMKSGDYKSWMLYMHPEQEKIATANLNGPGKLIGVSGSGKTCVVVRRAIWLANNYKDEKILVITLNKPLASLIRNLVSACAPEETLKNIDVKPFFSVCQEQLEIFEPSNKKLYDDVTWKSGEHIDEIWTEFYRCELNNNDAKVLLPIHFSLITRGINSEHYIREEFDWIRSAFSRDRRSEYLKVEREGRIIPFDIEARKSILKGLDSWEKKMRDVGVCDYLGLATELYNYKEKISKTYRSIIVDECQDFGNIELELVRALTPKDINDIFFCGDPAQRVQTKKQSMRLAGVECPPTRSLTLRKNYRNTKDILRAAFHVLQTHLHLEHLSLEDYEFLDPELADRSGTTPLILKAKNLKEEFSFAYSYLRGVLLESPEAKGCIAYCGFSNYEVGILAKSLGISLLDGAINIDESAIFLSDLEQTKGFEFDHMIILNCSSTTLPDSTAPKEEQYRDISRFYVAMTRTKQQLILSYSGEKSEILQDSSEHFLEDSWEQWNGTVKYPTLKEPPRLEQIRDEGTNDSLSLSGMRFIYHSDAIGLTHRSIEQLTKLVDGRGLRDKRGPKMWRTVGQLLLDMKSDPRVRATLGPIALEELSKAKFSQKILNPPPKDPEDRYPILSWKKQMDSSEAEPESI